MGLWHTPIRGASQAPLETLAVEDDLARLDWREAEELGATLD